MRLSLEKKKNNNNNNNKRSRFNRVLCTIGARSLMRKRPAYKQPTGSQLVSFKNPDLTMYNYITSI